LTLADLRFEVPPACYVSPSQGVPLHLVHRSVDKSGFGSRMGVGEW